MRCPDNYIGEQRNCTVTSSVEVGGAGHPDPSCEISKLWLGGLKTALLNKHIFDLGDGKMQGLELFS